jgi:hypothetical protein
LIDARSVASDCDHADDEDDPPPPREMLKGKKRLPPPTADSATTMELILQRIEVLSDRQRSLEGLVQQDLGRGSDCENTDSGTSQKSFCHATTGGYRRDSPPHAKRDVKKEPRHSLEIPRELTPRHRVDRGVGTVILGSSAGSRQPRWKTAGTS